MEQFNILASVRTLLDNHPELDVLNRYLSEEVFNAINDNSEDVAAEFKNSLLNSLSNLLLNDGLTTDVATLFSPILLELLTRASDFRNTNPIIKHEWLCICLSKLIWNFPDVVRFAKMYFEKSYGFFVRYEDEGEPPPKKQKTNKVAATYKLLKAANIFLIYDTQSFKDLINWSVLASFINNEDAKTRWFAYQCLGRVGNIKNIDEIVREKFTIKEFLVCASEDWSSQPWNLDQFRLKVCNTSALPSVQLKKEDFSKDVVNVENVLLSCNPDCEAIVETDKFVYVPSVQKSLYRLALAVSAGEPVLLQGPVGCGKTSIIEHLAALTGRRPFEELLKVQLGDHMDSKMLLGTHCCTDVPGEFAWKPGILIQAMTEGHWLLLEDIDCAPMDVISLLVPVLQSRTVALPGHANTIKAAAGFQLFATQRLVRGFEGSYLEFRSNTHIVESHFRKILMNPLSKNELKEVINMKWPSMKTISDKILQIYSLFSLDLDDENNTHKESSEEPFNLYCHHGRLVSTRDLFKFCERMSCQQALKADFNKRTFQNAVECFCDSIPSSETRLSAAKSIGVKINIPPSQANSYCQLKPAIVKRDEEVSVGRVTFTRPFEPLKLQKDKQPVFAYTRHSCALMEKVVVAVTKKEPVLLVGETGTGKTSVVQYLAYLAKRKLTVINMSQQSDSVDLIGGYKPVDLVLAVKPLRDEFMELFGCQNVIECDANNKFLQHISNCYHKKRYDYVAELMLHAHDSIIKKLSEKQNGSAAQLEQISAWKVLGEKIATLKQQIRQSKNTLIFKFIEGALVKAMKNGDWLLLDEINLAEAETLECLAGVLENNENALYLYEKGTKEPVYRHPDFHIFACMNPATDIGKKDLPVGIRNRFTEFFVDEIEDKKDLCILVEEYLKSLTLNQSVIENIVKFYLYIKQLSVQELNDGAGHYPHYSLRTLCRALKYASKNPCHNVPRSLYEAFCLSFLSQLDNDSHTKVVKIISEKLLGKSASVLKQSIPEPRNGKYISIHGYWVRRGNKEIAIADNYIFTNTVKRNLRDLARIVSAGQYPVLLQGETSVGKTSLIQWLAKATGNECVRVNNHEHTDIQEYVGTYSADSTGKLIFKEGILVEAMRNGYWIILDELNLAPTEVMEALNRVLDDNRELFIPETQTLVKAHPGFMIFATQNPPGLYGGRKLLSRAFRNRFIELHFNEIPPSELEEILHKRCKIPMQYSKKLVAVMHDLQILRKESSVFSGKHGFITLRDLFRWGERYEKTEEPAKGLDWLQHLADEGYLLLAGRVRVEEETKIIQETLQKHLKRSVKPNLLFNLSDETPLATRDILSIILKSNLSENFKNVVWTFSMRRLAVLVGKALQYGEPALLVGTTGSGKTTVCQIFAELYGRTLHSVNCHMHSESSDFVGGLRPVRSKGQEETKLFEWVDGPLINAMEEGNYFLADEISLADDSVLERLNSVLEPEQKILVPEKSFDDCNKYEVAAKHSFHFFATMNPGGDYGKKELSPALRNRFTEIWCPSSMSVTSDVIEIVEHNINKSLKFEKYSTGRGSGFGKAIAEFLNFHSRLGRRVTLSIRDVLTWVEFINLSQELKYMEKMSVYEAYMHGAFLAIVDGIGAGSSALSSDDYIVETKQKCFDFLVDQIPDTRVNYIELTFPELFEEEFDNIDLDFYYNKKKTCFGFGPFAVDCGPAEVSSCESYYEMKAVTTKSNLLKVLRAMQLSKPILLEGSPGVGKTSLISVLAKATGHNLVRVNLSEQTDISDLFGADLPIDGGETGEFAWRDGPLILALKKGDWILLDELNLASQSVLEGLNACLDHRNQIYIPELGKTFYLDKNISRIFCCQNPQRQGGSRKGLPQSFLNRFTKVYMKALNASDMKTIVNSMYEMKPSLISAMVQFNNEVSNHVNVERSWGHHGSPWEFNLRDIFRWCDLMKQCQNKAEYNIGEYMKLIYMDRMRTQEDKNRMCCEFEKVIKNHGLHYNQMIRNRHLKLNVYQDSVQLGYAFLPRKQTCPTSSEITCIPPVHLPCLESLMKCLEMNWMAILVGPSGSGKSTLVHSLAELCGQELHVLSVNSEMDTIELLGGFEQANFNRKLEYIAQDLQSLIESCISICLQCDFPDKGQKLQEFLYLQHKLSHTISSATSFQEDDLQKKLSCLNEVIMVIESYRPASSLVHSCREIQARIKCIKPTTCSGGRFEWVDSMLINAATKGHWLLIDDANFCSPSVLDRLNALLEPGGVLTVNEQGIVDGKLRTIVPHEDFRIILTVNPKYGEISRAMRNRGVEIYVDTVPIEINIEPPAPNIPQRQGLEIFSASLLAQCKGLIHEKLLIHFCLLYQKLSQCPELESPCFSDFLSAVKLCAQMIQKHGIAHKAFEDSCLAVFAENNLNASARNVAVNIIKIEVERISEIKADLSLPATDLIPSSFDYRQSTVYSNLKKQACLYTVFYKDMIRKIMEISQHSDGAENFPAIYVCRPPNALYLQGPYIYDVKKFASVLRIIFESCPSNCINYLNFMIRYRIQDVISTMENSDKETLKCFCATFTKYQEMVEKMTVSPDPLILKLKETVDCLLKVSEFSDILIMELPYDLRWNPYVYQKVMKSLKEKLEDPDSLESEFISRANRCSLLFVFKSLDIVNESYVGFSSTNCRNLALRAKDIAQNPHKFKDSPLRPLAYLPRFMETLRRSILEFLEDEYMPCTDDYYWKLLDVIFAYHIFERYYIMPAEKGFEYQMKSLALHLSWLLKKVRNLYLGVCRVPDALSEAAVEVETYLSCITPQQKFRRKCMKWLGLPAFFSDERAFNAFRIVLDLYQKLDVLELLKSPAPVMQDLKIIFFNMQNWLRSLGDSVYTSLYTDNVLESTDLSKITKIRAEILDSGISQDDDIMEICETPTKQPDVSSISDLELALNIQLTPLWDYLFVTYEAEMLSKALIRINNREIPPDREHAVMLMNWGLNVVGLNPVYLTHLIALLQINFKSCLVPSLLYFLCHTRHGFSSDGLLALNFEAKDNKINKTDVVSKHWNSYSWAKQYPVLSYIFSSLFKKTNGSSVMFNFPLGSYPEKIIQLKKLQVIVWKHFDKIVDDQKSFRYYSSSIVTSWFSNLISAMVSVKEGTLAPACDISNINKEDIINFCQELEISAIVEPKGSANILFLATESVKELQDLINKGVPDSELQWATGKTYVLVGLLTSVLLMPRDFLDPGKKAKTKYLANKDIQVSLMNELDMKKWINEFTCGQSLYREWVAEHPHSAGLKKLLGEYEKRLSTGTKKFPYRPSDDLYDKLKSDLGHFSATLASPKVILDLIGKLEKINNVSQEEADGRSTQAELNALVKAQTLAENLGSFVDQLMTKYYFFPDLLFPFLLGVEQITYGLLMSCNAITVKESSMSGPPQMLCHINKNLEHYSSFFTNVPKPSIHIASELLNQKGFSAFEEILSLKENFPDKGRLMYKLVKSAVLEILNEIKFQSYIPQSKLKEIKELLFAAFQYFHSIWFLQDNAKRNKKAKEAELYKTVHHDNEISDEEKFNKDLKEMFPFYEEEFEDIAQKSIDDESVKKPKTPFENNCADDDFMNFSDQDMFEVCQLHASAMAMLAGMDPKQHSNLFVSYGKELDILSPLLLRHEIISNIFSTLGHKLDSSLEKNLIKEQLLICAQLQELKGVEDNSYYDIYHDPNPPKVVTIKPVLQKLVNHVKDLLKEFPENPNLLQILVVTERVLSFPVSDPLMKFVAGLELILETSQHWEQNAHKKVSISQEIQEITAKVIEFRAMELNMWKNGLQNVIKKQYIKGSRWWFHLFTIVYAEDKCLGSEKEVIIDALQQCLECCPIGEFPATLSILRMFLQDLTLYKTAKQKRSYVNVLFNLYKYFEQFLPIIENKISELRKPIEKDLKDFVKIARWNDMNFYAVKASVEKSHRAVLKHVQAFEQALLMPSKTVFEIPSKSSPIKSWCLDIKEKDFVYHISEMEIQYFKRRSESFFQKLPKYQKKIEKITKKIAETTPIVGYVNTLNDFCGNIIEALEVQTGNGQKAVCTRSQEKKHALNKVQVKRQSLVSLFKNLKAAGLSYRQGLVQTTQDSIGIAQIMSLPPFDISKLKILSIDLSFKELLSKSSHDTNYYFYKSVVQFWQLRKLMQFPSKDLTLDHIQRVLGYAGCLMTFVSSQRIKIDKLAKKIDNFGCFLSEISTMFEKQDCANEENLTIIPPQQYLQKSYVELTDLIQSVSLAVIQFDMLLDCAPDSNILGDTLHPSFLDKNKLSGVLKGDDVWSEIKQAIHTFNCDIRSILDTLSELKPSDTIITWDHLRTSSAITQSVQNSLKKLLTTVSTHCNTDSALLQNLINLYTKVSERCVAAKEESDEILASQMTTEKVQKSKQSDVFVQLCQKLATHIILGIQEMFVFSSAIEEDKSANIVPDSLLTAKITGSLAEAYHCLRFDKISNIIKLMKQHFRNFQNSTETLKSNDLSFRLLVNLSPLLNQYYQLIKVHLAISMGMHRTSCKFFTILLKIFNILAEKGFCIPAELEEEAKKLPPVKFEDIESGGLGEGEGSKDVSDKIESEDQLDDAFKEGEEKKENDESKDKDLKDEKDGIEMTDDFEGKLHGGDGDAEDSDDEDDSGQPEDLDKQMGEVESDEAEKLNEQVWGSDSDNEENLRDDEGTGGMTEDMRSELAAKDNKPKDNADEGSNEKGNEPQEAHFDDTNEEYQGEKPDPMIDAPTQEPEAVDLPENMEITDDVEKDAEGENLEEMAEVEAELNEPEGEEANLENIENEELVDDEKSKTDEVQDIDGEEKEGKDFADQEEVEQPSDELAHKNEQNLPTQNPTDEVQALPSAETKKSSSDPVQPDESMEWEAGAQSSEEQHKEGLSDATNTTSEDPGHEGKKSSAKARRATEPKHIPKLKQPGDNRSVDESADEQSAKRRPIMDRKNAEKSADAGEDGDEAETYEHVSKDEESRTQAVDIASREEAEIRTVQTQNQIDDDDAEIIELSSDDEDEPSTKAVGETLKTNQSHKPGEKGGGEESESVDIPDGDIVQTSGVSRGYESTIHTQNELWRSLSSKSFPTQRLRHMDNINMSEIVKFTSGNNEQWGKIEMSVANLSQELCEQLRLVLEPTKMSKFKGDYRTGKRLNMRKIIPYIASQYRKDKIWLRRTKPSKRQYQIMLAIDDSKSMGYNKVKELAFKSLAVLGQSLTLLDAGELSVVSFGEKIQLLHEFQDSFSSVTGAKILEEVVFSQNKTLISEMLNTATNIMVQARNSSSSISSKETAQLLIIISDGRNIFSEGAKKVISAVKNAQDNNIFMVYLVLDNVAENTNSVLDGSYCSTDENGELIKTPYMDRFPFPFYIILREISALPQVLGEALRQWFELVTSVDR